MVCAYKHLNIKSIFAILKWYKLGLRKDFLLHKKKTMESFGFVRADISSIDNNIKHLKNAIYSADSRMSAIKNEISNLSKAIDKCSSEISIGHNQNLTIQSKIEQINKSVSNLLDGINSFRNNVNKIIFNHRQISKDISTNRNAIKKLFSVTKAESAKRRQLNFVLRKLQAEIKRVKKLKTKKLVIKTFKRKAKRTPKKTVKKTVTPKTRTMTEVKR